MRVSETSIVSANINVSNPIKDDLPLITANKNKNSLWTKFLEAAIFRNIEANFHSVRIKNKENYYLGNPQYARILYGTHTCFYDGQTVYYFCKKVFDSNFYMMIQELYRMPSLSKLGAFSVEKDSPYEAIKSINYAAGLLRDKEAVLWLFPQGRVMPPEHKPLKFESGLSYICNKIKNVNVIPVAVKYTFVRQEKPEIFVEIGKPVIIENGVQNKKELTECLENNLTYLAENQNYNVSQGNYDSYDYVYKNKIALYRRLEDYLKIFLYDKRFL